MVDYANPFNRLKLLVAIQEMPQADNVLELQAAKPVRKKRVEPPKVNIDWNKVSEVVEAPVYVEPSKEVITIESSDALGGLLGKALKTYNTILDIEIDRKDEDYVAIMRLKATACEKILGTQTKVDENVLRARNDNRLGDILQRLLEAKARIDAIDAKP